MSAAPRRLIVCADDFGWARASDRRIVALAERGRITAVSVLVDAPALPQHQLGHALPATNASVGLHLNLTEALAQPPTAAFRPLPLATLALRAHTRRLDQAQIDAEVERQFAAFTQHVGRVADFVDGHQHVHQLPMIRIAIDRAIARRAPARIRLRNCRPARATGAKAQIIGAFGGIGYTAIQRLAGHTFERTQRVDVVPRRRDWLNAELTGAYDFSAPPSYAQRMAGWLDGASDGALLFCHPGAAADDLPLAAAREAEAQFFESVDWPRMLAARRIDLVATLADR